MVKGEFMSDIENRFIVLRLTGGAKLTSNYVWRLSIFVLGMCTIQGLLGTKNQLKLRKFKVETHFPGMLTVKNRKLWLITLYHNYRKWRIKIWQSYLIYFLFSIWIIHFFRIFSANKWLISLSKSLALPTDWETSKIYFFSYFFMNKILTSWLKNKRILF